MAATYGMPIEGILLTVVVRLRDPDDLLLIQQRSYEGSKRKNCTASRPTRNRLPG
jgi:hypothetical protein